MDTVARVVNTIITEDGLARMCHVDAVARMLDVVILHEGTRRIEEVKAVAPESLRSRRCVVTGIGAERGFGAFNLRLALEGSQPDDEIGRASCRERVEDAVCGG